MSKGTGPIDTFPKKRLYFKNKVFFGRMGCVSFAPYLLTHFQKGID